MTNNFRVAKKKTKTKKRKKKKQQNLIINQDDHHHTPSDSQCWHVRSSHSVFQYVLCVPPSPSAFYRNDHLAKNKQTNTFYITPYNT